MKTKYTEIKIEKEHSHNDPDYVGYMVISFNVMKDEMAKFFALSFEEKIEEKTREICKHSTVINEDWSIIITPNDKKEYLCAPALVGLVRKCEEFFEKQLTGGTL